MTKRQNTKILFIINPKSWPLSEDETAALTSDFARDHQLEKEVYFTRAEDHSEDFGRKIADCNAGIVVAAGGDGTVNMVASQLINKDIPLGIIPAGSANGLAFNLNIPVDTQKALAIIGQEKTMQMDVLKINDSEYCYHLADFGINARIVHRFEKEGSSGLLGYGKQMFKELFNRQDPFRFKLSTPNTEKKCKAVMLVIANASHYGTGAAINPGGKSDDGLFELVVIKPYPWYALASLAFSFLSGKPEKLKYVERISTKEAQIKLDKPRNFQNDGEIRENIQKLNIKVLPAALNIFIP